MFLGVQVNLLQVEVPPFHSMEKANLQEERNVPHMTPLNMRRKSAQEERFRAQSYHYAGPVYVPYAGPGCHKYAIKHACTSADIGWASVGHPAQAESSLCTALRKYAS